MVGPGCASRMIPTSADRSGQVADGVLRGDCAAHATRRIPGGPGRSPLPHLTDGGGGQMPALG